MDYDPHEDVDIYGEMQVMGRGRLVKARLPDQPVPNVGWYWFPVGNCAVCKFYQRPDVGGVEAKCLNPKISPDDFWTEYQTSNLCPEFAIGPAPKQEDGAGLDVMRAVGLIAETPKQRVDIIRDEPWSIEMAEHAHREASAFLDMARMADYVARGGENDPHTLEYVDLSDDLEPKAGGVGAVPTPPASP